MTTASGSAPGRTSADGADAARARLAAALRASGRTPSPAVQAAFLAVPRHLFVPGLAPAAAYQDEALVIKYSEDGLPISSSSQPAMMAIMLEQLGLKPGHRVLEIGAGTGYNAAVMAHIVGSAGEVVTVDIDPDLVARARASLAAAGYGQVQARCADGGFGDPGGAPFDRVIVTVGAWDIAPAWLDQLGPGGRLVLPLALRGIQLSIGLERSEDPPGSGHQAHDHWVSTSAFRCGFVQMAGAFADPEAFQPLPSSPGLYVQAGDGRQVDMAALARVVAGPPADVGAGITARSRDELADLDLWLTLTEPELDRLTFMATAASRGRSGPLLPFGALASRDRGRDQPGVAGLAGASPSGAADRPGIEPAAFPGEIVMRGYGRAGAELAAHLARRAPAWGSLGRPGAAGLSLTVCPAGADPAGADPAGGDLVVAAGQIALSRPHVRLAAGWPVR
jgi:protein-L-isoaspartate(D-aspartate) O-methyltransferase